MDIGGGYNASSEDSGDDQDPKNGNAESIRGPEATVPSNGTNINQDTSTVALGRSGRVSESTHQIPIKDASNSQVLRAFDPIVAQGHKKQLPQSRIPRAARNESRSASHTILGRRPDTKPLLAQKTALPVQQETMKRQAPPSDTRDLEESRRKRRETYTFQIMASASSSEEGDDDENASDAGVEDVETTLVAKEARELPSGDITPQGTRSPVQDGSETPEASPHEQAHVAANGNSATALTPETALPNMSQIRQIPGHSDLPYTNTTQSNQRQPAELRVHQQQHQTATEETSLPAVPTHGSSGPSTQRVSYTITNPSMQSQRRARLVPEILEHIVTECVSKAKQELGTEGVDRYVRELSNELSGLFRRLSNYSSVSAYYTEASERASVIREELTARLQNLDGQIFQLESEIRADSEHMYEGTAERQEILDVGSYIGDVRRERDISNDDFTIPNVINTDLETLRPLFSKFWGARQRLETAIELLKALNQKQNPRTRLPSPSP